MIFFSATDGNDILVLLVSVFLRVVTIDFLAFALVVLDSRSGSDVVIGLFFILARGLLWICLLANGTTSSGLATFS